MALNAVVRNTTTNKTRVGDEIFRLWSIFFQLNRAMSSTIFSSDTSQHRWADKLNHHFTIFVENPPSIFQVPKSIAATNPGAYTPQEIGIGPYHRFRRDLEDMESTKLAATKTYLSPEQLHNFNSLVVDRVRALEPAIRSCYDKYLDLDTDTLAWAMAIDGVLLLHLLSKYKPSYSGILELLDMSPYARRAAKDVLMMENQFPSIVLYEIRNALSQPSNVADISSVAEEFDESKVREELLSEMSFFSNSHSVFDVQWCAPLTNSPHVLDLMYRKVAMSLSRQEFFMDQPVGASFPTLLSALCQLIAAAATSIGLEFPYEEFLSLFRNENISAVPKSSLIQKIQIPSASQLHRAVKIQFKTSCSISRAFEYVEDTRTLYLPMMRLATDSEVIIRNLVAYESALGSTVVSGFVDFMCGLIDTEKDVDLLKEKYIIHAELASGEVAKMFNGINKSSGMVSDLQQITQKLNEAYDSTFRVRFFRFVKKHLIPSVNSVKILLWMLLVSLFVLQAFCQIYGCREHWFS